MKTREEIAAMEMLLDAKWLNSLGYFIRRDTRNRNNTIRFDKNGNEIVTIGLHDRIRENIETRRYLDDRLD